MKDFNVVSNEFKSGITRNKIAVAKNSLDSGERVVAGGDQCNICRKHA